MREDIKLWIKQFALESTGIHIDETLGKISGNLNQIEKRISSTGNVYGEEMAEVKAIMDEVWKTQKAMLKKQPLIHNK